MTSRTKDVHNVPASDFVANPASKYLYPIPTRCRLQSPFTSGCRSYLWSLYKFDNYELDKDT